MNVSIYRPYEVSSLLSVDIPAPSVAEPGGDANLNGVLEPFPIEAFPPCLRAVAGDMARVYQTPISLPAMSTLAVLSGAVGKSVQVRGGYKDRATRLNLYVVPVAERGGGKGVIGETLCAPLSRRSAELSKKHRLLVGEMRGELGILKKEVHRLEQDAAGTDATERLNSMGTLTKGHSRIEELEIEATRERTLVVGDTTSEALGKALADNGEELFSYSSEAGAAVKVALGKYTEQGDFDLLLSGYSGDAVRTSRVTRRSVQLQSPCLSLLWLVQPCVVQRLVGEPEAISRGLTARLLMFETNARREHDDRGRHAFMHGDIWNETIDNIVSLRLANLLPREILCTSEATEVFARFNDESVDLERERYADMAGELSRWRENAVKVAGLFALAEGAYEISASQAERAVSVVRWIGMSHVGLLQNGRRERLQRELERVLDLIRENGGEVNLGVLARDHGVRRPQLDALVAVFPNHLEMFRRSQNGPGRPAELLRAVTKSTNSTELGRGTNKVDLVDLLEGEASP